MQNTLSVALWQHSAVSFLPHQTVGEAELQHAPIHLYIGEGKVIQDDILINLDQEVPLFFGRFNQLIELVDDVESNKIAARTRWKFYRDRGYVLRSTDSSQKNG